MTGAKELILTIISVALGAAMTIWGVYMIVRYFRTPRGERRRLKPYVWVAVVILLLGSGDLAKAVRDAVKLARGETPAARSGAE